MFNPWEEEGKGKEPSYLPKAKHEFQMDITNNGGGKGAEGIGASKNEIHDAGLDESDSPNNDHYRICLPRPSIKSEGRSAQGVLEDEHLFGSTPWSDVVVSPSGGGEKEAESGTKPRTEINKAEETTLQEEASQTTTMMGMTIGIIERIPPQQSSTGNPSKVPTSQPDEENFEFSEWASADLHPGNPTIDEDFGEFVSCLSPDNTNDVRGSVLNPHSSHQKDSIMSRQDCTCSSLPTAASSQNLKDAPPIISLIKPLTPKKTYGTSLRDTPTKSTSIDFAEIPES